MHPCSLSMEWVKQTVTQEAGAEEFHGFNNRTFRVTSVEVTLMSSLYINCNLLNHPEPLLISDLSYNNEGGGALKLMKCYNISTSPKRRLAIKDVYHIFSLHSSKTSFLCPCILLRQLFSLIISYFIPIFSNGKVLAP